MKDTLRDVLGGKRHQTGSQSPTTATEGISGAETNDPAPAPALTRAERERRLLEGAGFDPDKRATSEEIRAREDKRRAEHQDTTQSRSDEGLER